jgi:uncharacterized protein
VKIYAIGDLHLGHAVDKPMDIFGPRWKDHTARIRDSWNRTVGESDLVLVPGDLSWAMRMEEAEEDLHWLDALSGKKLVIKGNHDYWWAAISRLRRKLSGGSIYPLQYDSVSVGALAVGGTRLWNLPGMTDAYVDPLKDTPGETPGSGQSGGTEEDDRIRDEKIFRREMGRLESSLESMDSGAGLRIVMTHFPPTDESGKDTPVTRILRKYRTDICVFGHLHSLMLPHGRTWDFRSEGIRYVLVSCDAVGFAPYLLTEVPEADPHFPW